MSFLLKVELNAKNENGNICDTHNWKICLGFNFPKSICSAATSDLLTSGKIAKFTNCAQGLTLESSYIWFTISLEYPSEYF